MLYMLIFALGLRGNMAKEGGQSYARWFEFLSLLAVQCSFP